MQRASVRSKGRLGWVGSLAASLVLLAGCGSGSDRGADATTRAISSELSAPVTITLAAPNAVPPLSPVVSAGNSLFFGASAELVTGSTVAMGASGGGVHAEPDALLNDTWSRGTADLRDRVHVRGTLHAAARTLGSNVQITSSDTAPAFDPVQALSWTVAYPSTTTGPAVLLNAGQSQSLAPGQYGQVTLNSQSTLTLHTGTYYLSGLDLESASKVNLDQSAGPVIIYADTGLILRGSFASLTTDPPDLLIAFLGTNSFLIETLFNGAIIAPFATMTLRAVTGIHTGFFYAKDFQILDAHARVQYRAPLPIITAAKPNGSSCAAIVSALVPPASLQAALARYCTACVQNTDTDGDHVLDCLDGCPYDPAKTAPGACNCGTPDTDSDGDGTPDCLDQCPHDPQNTSAGQCGCLGAPGLKPAGTRCTDTACPQSNATCDGAGVCGNRQTCSPATGCKLITWHETSYWLCQPSGAPGGSSAAPVSESGAEQACSAKGLTLTRVDSLGENRFINQFLKSPLWLGANDITAANAWRWSTPNSNNGDQFWSGGASGAPVAHHFSFWKANAPGTQRCAAMLPDSSGQWGDVNCSEALGYVCEFREPASGNGGGGSGTGGPMPPGAQNQPVPLTKPCIPESLTGLPDTKEALAAMVATDKNSMGQTVTPISGNPPSSTSTCSDNPTADAVGSDSNNAASGCRFINVVRTSDCLVDADCGGNGFVCRQVTDVAACITQNAATPSSANQCKGHARCGQLSCPDSSGQCDQVEVCNPGTTFTAVLDTGSTLAAQPFSPAALFGGTVPTANPSTQYVDLPSGVGHEHTWCSLSPQDPNSVKPASQPSPPYHGQSGTGDLISFAFDPNLLFDAKSDALPLGETNLTLHALAGISTTVSVNNFLKQSFTSNILQASIGMKMERCSINNVDDTKFTVFGLDAVTLDDLGLPSIDSRVPGTTLNSIAQTCQDSVGQYVLAANRAKKAFRDAQQLVSQYNAARALGKTLNSDLCTQLHVADATVPGFPGGNTCPTGESVEATIDRFVDFYQAPGTGALTTFTNAQSTLSTATKSLKGAIGTSLTFGGDPNEESQTILNVPFLIGPVPMLLQIDVFAQYGVEGAFEPSLDMPFSPFTAPTTTSQQLAKVDARVAPFAAAGLDAFVGAGLDLGVISATIGLEGIVTLANISAPIFAGVTLNASVVADARPLPPDVAGAVTSATDFVFGGGKSYKFSVGYDYGAGVDVNNVLSGTLNGRLRIKFFFFSRTWRKQIVQFTGWSKHFDLISGGNDPSVSLAPDSVSGDLKSSDGTPDTAGLQTNVATGNTTMGLTEAQVPLMKLQRPSGTTTLPVTQFSTTNMQSAFYDSLCCSRTDEVCVHGLNGQSNCCPGFNCVDGPETNGLRLAFCQPQCKNSGQSCTSVSDCCPATAPSVVAICQAGTNVCGTCVDDNGPCGAGPDCCSGQCFGGFCSKAVH
jgi:Lectin C-type domain